MIWLKSFIDWLDYDYKSQFIRFPNYLEGIWFFSAGAERRQRGAGSCWRVAEVRNTRFRFAWWQWIALTALGATPHFYDLRRMHARTKIHGFADLIRMRLTFVRDGIPRNHADISTRWNTRVGYRLISTILRARGFTLTILQMLLLYVCGNLIDRISS